MSLVNTQSPVQQVDISGDRLYIGNVESIEGTVLRGGVTIKRVYTEFNHYLFYIEGVGGEDWAINLNRSHMVGGFEMYELKCITNNRWVGLGRNRIKKKTDFIKHLKELID